MQKRAKKRVVRRKRRKNPGEGMAPPVAIEQKAKSFKKSAGKKKKFRAGKTAKPLSAEALAAKRKRAAEKAATTRAAKAEARAAKAEARSAAAKKGARTRKRKAAAKEKAASTRRKPVAKKKKVSEERAKASAKKRSPRERGKLTAAQRSAAAKKGWRRKRAKASGVKAASDVKAKTRRVRRKQVVTRKRGLNFKFKPTARRVAKRMKVKTAAYKTKKGRRAYRAVIVKRNPMAAIKSTLVSGGMAYLGLVGVRLLSNLVSEHVTKGYLSATASTAPKMTDHLLSVLPAGLGMLALALSGKVIKGKPAIVSGLQIGGAIGFFDALMQAVLKATIGVDSTTGKLKQPYGYLVGMFGEYISLPYGGYGEYVSQQLPQYQQQPVGVDVEEAMADYVADPQRRLTMGGFDVEEALADDEVHALQSGYAEGTLKHTVFNS